MTCETTRHQFIQRDAADMTGVADGSVDLVVTSPPYPMIEMWDETFTEMDGRIGEALADGDGDRAFESMHARLDEVWGECLRVLRPGGIACINVGDATRTIGGEFRLYSNHARILQQAARLGFSILPDVLWRKQTNAPNKFLGSGMLPAGAYVTYEHEYVLIVRKGTNRKFVSEAEKARRRRSAFFWEERNVWFSDVWTDLKGTTQLVVDPDARSRSAAFPFELAYRLIQMHSLIGDTVLDPFLGTGTTMAAALASGRHGLGFERDPTLAKTIGEVVAAAAAAGRTRARRRLAAHAAFVEDRLAAGKKIGHTHAAYGFPVITRQETELELVAPRTVTRIDDATFTAELEPVTLADPGGTQIEFDFA